MRAHRRDRYLRWLAAQPLFADVPRHLVPVFGRHVDVLDLGTGTGITTTPSREVIIVVEGFAVVHDPDQDAYAVVGPDSPVRPAVPRLRARLTAITPLRCLVIARRELEALCAMAPALARATAGPGPMAAPGGHPRRHLHRWKQPAGDVAPDDPDARWGDVGARDELRARVQSQAP